MMNLTAVDESRKAAHTPTPWVTDADGRSVTTIPKPTETMSLSLSGSVGQSHTEMMSRTVARCAGHSESRADAAFIVRAVNSYNDLLIIAKEALCELDPDCKYDGERWERGMSDREGLIIGLYEAIAKAEGK